MKTNWWAMTVVGSLLATVTARARAEPPATAGAVQIGLGLRYGFEMEEGDFNPWGLGLGLDAGITLHNAVYVGANGEYFFGEKLETPLGDIEGNVWQVSGEGGYDVGLGPNFVIRPKLGLGVASVQSCIPIEIGEDCASASATHFAATPGANFIVSSEHFTLNLDVRYDMIFADGDTLNAILFSAGIGF